MDIYDSKIQRKLAPQDGSIDVLAERVAELKELFQKEYQENQQLYDPRDYDRFMDKQDDWHARRWIIYQREVPVAFEMLKDTMRWRKGLDLNGLSYEDFPREFYECGCIFEYGQDKKGKQVESRRIGPIEWKASTRNEARLDDRGASAELTQRAPLFTHNNQIGRRVMYIRCRLFRPMSELNELYDKFFAFMIDQCDKRSKCKGFSMMYDVTDAGLSNVEMVSPKEFLAACVGKVALVASGEQAASRQRAGG